jgi:hypothetical protein
METAAVEERKYRGLYSIATVAVAVGVAYIGRRGLDCLIGFVPAWTDAIETFGGWALGMVVAMFTIPIFRMYGVFDNKTGRSRGGNAANNADAGDPSR